MHFSPRLALTFPMMSLDKFREDIRAMRHAAIGETNYRTRLMKAKLNTKIQNTLRKMDPANQSVEKQYEFLVQQRLGLVKAEI